MKKKKIVIPIIAVIAAAAAALCVYIFTTPVPVVPRGGDMDVSFVSIWRPDNSYVDIEPTTAQSKAILLLIDEYTATRQFADPNHRSVTFEMRVSVTRNGKRQHYLFTLGGVQPDDGRPKPKREHFGTNIVTTDASMFSYKIQNAEEFVDRVIEILDPDGTKNLELQWN